MTEDDDDINKRRSEYLPELLNLANSREDLQKGRDIEGEVGRPGLVVTRVGCHTANILFAGWRYPVGIYT